MAFIGDTVSVPSVPCLAWLRRFRTISLLFLRRPLDVLGLAGTSLEASLYILNSLVSKPETILRHLHDQVNQLDDRVISAHAQSLDESLLFGSLIIFLGKLSFFPLKFLDLLNSLLDFPRAEDAANSPAICESCQKRSFLLQLPSDLQCNCSNSVPSVSSLDLECTSIDVLDKEDLLGALDIHVCIAHPTDQLAGQSHFLSTFRESVELERVSNPIANYLASKQALEEDGGFPLVGC